MGGETEAKRTVGRPKGRKGGERFFEGKLHAMLIEKLPGGFVRGGRIDTGALSEASGISRVTLLRAMREDRLTRKVAVALLTVGRSTQGRPLATTDLVPFLLAA